MVLTQFSLFGIRLLLKSVKNYSTDCFPSFVFLFLSLYSSTPTFHNSGWFLTCSVNNSTSISSMILTKKITNYKQLVD